MTKLNRRALIRGVAAGAALAPLAASLPAWAQTPVQTDTAQAEYVRETLSIGSVALRTSQLALTKAQDAMVREFASLEVGEQNAIAGVLAATSIMPPELMPDQAMMIQRLNDMQAGPDFDRAYLEGQLMGHNQLLVVQQRLRNETRPSVEVITARLAEQSVTTHIAMLTHMLAMASSANSGQPNAAGNPAAGQPGTGAPTSPQAGAATPGQTGAPRQPGETIGGGAQPGAASGQGGVPAAQPPAASGQTTTGAGSPAPVSAGQVPVSSGQPATTTAPPA